MGFETWKKAWKISHFFDPDDPEPDASCTLEKKHKKDKSKDKLKAKPLAKRRLKPKAA